MRTAYRARKIIPLSGERGVRDFDALNAPPAVLDDGVVLVAGGYIEAVEKYADFTRRAALKLGEPLKDLGEVTLAPGLINCHSHLELSHLWRKTTLGQGFTPWLASLIPLAAAPASHLLCGVSLNIAMDFLKESGTAHVGDITSRAPTIVAAAADTARITLTHFVECFGYDPPQNHIAVAGGYCPAVVSLLLPDRYANVSAAGHALYTTSPEALKAAHAWAQRANRVFAMHLAEHEEETELLVSGGGPMREILQRRVFPEDWRAPGKRPVPLARELGLLGENTLAVHCVQCSADEVEILARTGTAVCLCPRSNRNIAVGTAPAMDMAKAGVLLCLGTDSLASCEDLRLDNEMRAAEAEWGFSPQALLRMATVNGAQALGVSGLLGSLEPGKRFAYSIVREQ